MNKQSIFKNMMLAAAIMAPTAVVRADEIAAGAGDVVAGAVDIAAGAGEVVAAAVPTYAQRAYEALKSAKSSVVNGFSAVGNAGKDGAIFVKDATVTGCKAAKDRTIKGFEYAIH